MLELLTDLSFACCGCNESIGVTVKCSGKGLTMKGRALAAVNVPCPTCSTINRLFFEPSGAVRDVVPLESSHPALEPSMN